MLKESPWQTVTSWKMTLRIMCWSSRHLSYAARSVLINAVLMSIHVYWAQVFLLPKAVLDKIARICRAFLWEGKATLSRAPPISWDRICWPKKQGGRKSSWRVDKSMDRSQVSQVERSLPNRKKKDEHLSQGLFLVKQTNMQRTNSKLQSDFSLI